MANCASGWGARCSDVRIAECRPDVICTFGFGRFSLRLLNGSLISSYLAAGGLFAFLAFSYLFGSLHVCIHEFYISVCLSVCMSVCKRLWFHGCSAFATLIAFPFGCFCCSFFNLSDAINQLKEMIRTFISFFCFTI